jgi:hypothetical protein
MFRIVILPIVVYGCETWSFTLREERRLIALESGVLSIICGPMRDEMSWEWRNYIIGNLYSSLIIVRAIISIRMRWAGNVAGLGERREVYTGFCWGSLRERDHLGDQSVDERIILRWIF